MPHQPCGDSFLPVELHRAAFHFIRIRRRSVRLIFR
jgi:hypothetical protein